jgi:hypothetical protein
VFSANRGGRSKLDVDHEHPPSQAIKELKESRWAEGICARQAGAAGPAALSIV